MSDEKETKQPTEQGAEETGADEPQVLALKRKGGTWRLSRRQMLLAAATGAGALVMDGCVEPPRNNNNSNSNANSNYNYRTTPTPTPTAGNYNSGSSGSSGSGYTPSSSPTPRTYSRPTYSPPTYSPPSRSTYTYHYWRPN